MKQGPLDGSIGTEAVDDWPEEKKLGALRILWQHREVIHSLVFRDIRSRYKQSVLGIAWALLQPLAVIAAYLASLGRWLIIEFVPKTDRKVMKLLATREDVFPNYTREGFEREFKLRETPEIRDSERVLYLMERRAR